MRVKEKTIQFQKIYGLSRKQPWLDRVESQLMSLLSECSANNQVDLIIDLLHDFTFLNDDGVASALESIARSIVGLNFPEDHVQVVATSADDNPDSGQFVVYYLKPIFSQLDWNSVQLVNRFGRAQRYAKERPVVCLVDEFVGTGRTAIGRAEALRRDFKNNLGVEDVRIFLFAIAGMEHALQSLKTPGKFDGVHFEHCLRRGISGRSADCASRLTLMKKIETVLSADFNGVQMPSLGDGQCEALYGRSNGNAPNSVFPVFWWPRNSKGSKRVTLLTRRV